jgi:cysteine synthase B
MATAKNALSGPATDPALWLGVGLTPLLELSRVGAPFLSRARVLAKAEWHNPGGSIKDRPALWMIRQAERAGRLNPRLTILDASSGNTGIAYAWIGAKLGYSVRLAIPSSVGAERRRVLLAFGAQLDLTSPLEGSDGAIRRARALHAESPSRYFYPDQYSNDDNWGAHAVSTAQEVWAQTSGEVTHFVAGLGTSGTFRGTATGLRRLNPSVRAVAVHPDSAMHGLEGLKHMPTSLVPKIYDPALADENLTVSTEEALAMAARLAREEALLVGLSGAANVAAALKLAERSFKEGKPAVVVTVLPDSGERHLASFGPAIGLS